MELNRIYELSEDFDRQYLLNALIKDYGYEDCYYDYEAEFRWSETPIASLASLSLRLASSLLSEFRQIPELRSEELTDEELSILTSWEIAKIYNNKRNQIDALNRAAEESREASNIERYGTRARAENRLYDRFMSEKYNGPEYSLLDAIIETIESEKEKAKQV